MSKIVFYTQAYNAEKTLAKTIESVLSQTLRDFVYYIGDNGSTDGTLQIISQYAKKDPRIRLYRREENSFFLCQKEAMDLVLSECPDALYWAGLDADDWVEPNFAEKMVGYMDGGADLAICSVSFWQDTREAGQPLARAPSRIWTGPPSRFCMEEVVPLFPYLHQHFRTLWGKVYRLEILRAHNLRHPEAITCGDTMFVFSYLAHVKSIFITNEALLNYRVYSGSQTSRYEPDHIQYIETLNANVKRFLKENNGETPFNLYFCRAVHFYDYMDMLRVAIREHLSGRPLKHPLSDLLARPAIPAFRAALNEPARPPLSPEVVANDRTAFYDSLYGQARILSEGGDNAHAFTLLAHMNPSLAAFWGPDDAPCFFRAEDLPRLLLAGGAQASGAAASFVPGAADPFSYSAKAYWGILSGRFLPAFEYLVHYGNDATLRQRDFIFSAHPLLQRVENAPLLLACPDVLYRLADDALVPLLDDLPARIAGALDRGAAALALVLCRLGLLLAAAQDAADHFLFFTKAELECLLETRELAQFESRWLEAQDMMPGDEELSLLRAEFERMRKEP